MMWSKFWKSSYATIEMFFLSKADSYYTSKTVILYPIHTNKTCKVKPVNKMKISNRKFKD